MNAFQHVIFIAGPYSGTKEEIKKHIEQAALAAKALWKGGYIVLCPHTNSAGFEGIMPEDGFYEGYQTLLARCDCVLALGEWSKSAGAYDEVIRALELGLPVFYSIEEALAGREKLSTLRSEIEHVLDTTLRSFNLPEWVFGYVDKTKQIHYFGRAPIRWKRGKLTKPEELQKFKSFFSTKEEGGDNENK